MPKPQQIHQFLSRLFDPPFALYEPRGAQHRAQKPVAELMMLGDANVFENAQAVPKADTLERARDSQGRNLMRSHAAYILVQKADLAFRRAVKAAHQVENGRLAGAVRAYQAHQLTALEGQVKIIYRPKTPEKVR